MNKKQIAQEERMSDLMHEVMGLAGKGFSYDEMRTMVAEVENLQRKGYFEVRTDTMTRGDEIDILLNNLSSHEKSPELAWVLGIFTAYNIDGPIYLKYFKEEDTEEVLNRIASFEAYEEDQELEEETCNIILDTLGFGKVMEIIDNAEIYIDQFIKIDIAIDDLKDSLYKQFAKIE